MGILVVGEVTAIQDQIVSHLQKQNYSIIKVANSKNALSIINEQQIDVVITDRNLSDMDGFEFSRKIKFYKSNYIYIIMLNFDTEKGDRIAGFEAGVDHFLHNSEDLGELEALIKNGIRVSRFEKKATEKEVILENFDNKKTEEKGIIKTRRDYLVAKYAIANNLINKDQLAKALSILKKKAEAFQAIPLEDIFLETGMLSSDLVHDFKIFIKRKMGKQFGTKAVRVGFVTQEQVNDALKIQAEEFTQIQKCRQIGDILVDKGVMTSEQRDLLRLDQDCMKRKSPDKEMSHKTEQECKEEKTHTFELITTEEQLNAWIKYKGNSPDTLSISDVKEFIEQKKIVKGVVSDEKITEFINQISCEEKDFLIAKGEPYKPGKDSYVKFFFDIEYLTAGAINEKGDIDYRNRGEIPRIEKESLTAEKIPMEKGEYGVDVYGNPIVMPEIQDVEFLSGEGTKLSEDGLKIVSIIDGQPNVSKTGKISVFAELNIKDDIDFTTGNIDFKGNINVGGTIQDGFIVKGVNISAKEIVGAQIFASGDVIVIGGIIDAAIVAEGLVSAKYIKNSNIKTFGNLVFEKELMGSKIRTSSKIITERGKIISSYAAAKMGLEVKDIGTDVSKPCKIKINADENIRKIVQKLDFSLKKKIDILESNQFEFEKLVQKQLKEKEQLTKLKKVYGLLVKEQEKIKDQFKALVKEDNKQEIVEKKKVFKELIEKAKNVENGVSINIRSKVQLEEKMSDKLNSVEKIIKKIEGINEEKRAINKWSEKEKSIPIIKVNGSIFDRTIIEGYHTNRMLEETYRNVTIKEVKVANSESKLSINWEIEVIKA
jgi:uncharacterized protein